MKPKFNLQSLRRHRRIFRNGKRLLLAPSATVWMLAMTPIHAQTWDGGGTDDNILTPDNWVGNNVPVSNLSNTDLIFSGTTRLTPVFDTPFSAKSLTFDASAGSFTFSGSTLSLGSGGIVNNSSNSMVFDSAVDFSGVSSSTINAANGNLIFNNTVQMSDGLTLVGSGAVTIGPDGVIDIDPGQFLNAQTDLTINGGSLTSSNTDPYAVSMASGTTLAIQNGGSATFAGEVRNLLLDTIHVTGAGSILGTASDFYTNGNSIVNVQSGGSLVIDESLAIAFGSIGNGTVNVSGQGSSVAVGQIVQIGGSDNGSLSFSDGSVGTLGAIRLSSPSLELPEPTGTGVLSVASGSVVTGTSLQIADFAGDTTGTLVITGAGSALNLTGPSTIGAASASTATLNLQNGGTFSTATGTTTLNPTGTINLDGGIFVQNGAINRAGGALNFNSGTWTANVPFSVGTGGVLGSGGGTGDLTLGTGMELVINGGGGIDAGRTLALSGGSLDLASGTTEVNGLLDNNGGTLTIDGALNINSGATFNTGTNPVLMGSSGSLNLPGGSVNVEGLLDNNGGTLTFNNGTLNVNSGGTFQSGTNPITAGTGSTIAIAGGTYTSEGNLTLDGGQLTRDAAGSFTLAAGKTLTVQNGGNATFTGELINATESTITVSDIGSTLATGGGIELRSGSTNVLAGADLIVGGGSGVTKIGFISGLGPIDSTVLVDGAGSVLSGGQLRLVGSQGGTASLKFRNGGTGSFSEMLVGDSLSNGVNSILSVESGSIVTGTRLLIAANPNLQTGTVTITGADSSLTLSGSLDSSIGTVFSSTAALNIQNGGTFTTNTGTTTLNSTGTINLGGGIFVQNGTLSRNGGDFNFTSGTFTANVPFAVGAGGILGSGGGTGDLTLGTGKTLNTSSTATIDAGRTLAIGAGTYNVLGDLTVNGTLNSDSFDSFRLANGSSLIVQNGGDIALDGDFRNGNGGATSILVTGAGSTFTNFGSYVENGSTLNVQAGANYSSLSGPVSIGTSGTGVVTVNGSGSSFGGGGITIGAGGTVDIQNGGFYSAGSTDIVAGGAINVNQSNAAFGTMNHGGALNITGGSVGITGVISQSAGSSITLSGNSTATFQDIYQRDAGTFTTQSGSTAIFNGAVSGPGGFDGAGTVEFHGSYSPGSSPGIVSIAGNAVFGSGNTLNMEIAGLTPGTQHDRINIGGNTALGGAVNLAFTSNTFFPQVGNSFVIMDTGGTFTDSAVYSASGLRSGWQFSTAYNAGTGELTVTSLSKGVPLGAPVTNVTWNTNAVGNWSEAAKWSSNPHVPNNSNNNSVYNVTQNNGTVTVDQVIEIDAYTMTGFATNTGGAGTLNLSGLFTWTGGAINGTGALNANAGIDMLGVIGRSITDRTVTTDGITTWASSGFQFTLAGNASINNHGIWNVTGEQGMSGGTFNNSGDFNKSGGTETVISTTFNNTATGKVTLSNATRLNLNGIGTNAHAGTFDIGAGSTLIFNIGGNSPTDIHQFNEGAAFTGSGTVEVQGRFVANANIAIGPRFVMSGPISGPGTITTTGIADWEQGTLFGVNPATDILNTNGTLNISAADNRIIDGRTLNTSGTTNWGVGGYGWNNYNGAVINNLQGGVWNVTGTQGMAGGTFNNAGSFIKSAGTATGISSAFNNLSTGTVSVTNGTTLLFATAGGSHAGAFNIGAGSTLQIGSGNHELNAGASISGAGTLRLTGGTLTANTDIAIPTAVLLDGGTLNGAGTVTLNGPVTWTSFSSMTGTNAVADKTTINGDLTISGGAQTMNLTTRTLNTTGNVFWTSGGGNLLNVSTGAVINNSGNWDISGVGSLGAPGGGTFNNSGEINKTAGGVNNISPVFNNTGTVSVGSGVGSGLTMLGEVTQHVVSTLTGGTWTVSNGSALVFNTGSNITTIGTNARVTLDGAGSSFAKINTLNNNQGSFTVKNGRDFTTGGNLANSGTVRIEGSTTLTIGTGGTYTQTAGETLLSGNSQLTASAVVVNGGIVVVGTDGTSTLTSAVTVNDGGTLSGSGTIIGNVTVNSGGVHAPGNSPGIEAVNGNLTYNSSSIFEWDLNANTVTQSGGPPYLFDQVTSTGGHTLTVNSGAIFRIVLGTGVDLDNPFWSTPHISQTWSNIFTGFGSLVGGFNTANIQVTGQSVTGYGSFSISGTTLTWSAIPEPTTALAGILLGAGLLRRTREKQPS